MMTLFRARSRRWLTAAATSMSVVIAGSVAWAAAPDITKVRGYSYSSTYQVTALPNTSQHEVPWPSVGDVELVSVCSAGYLDPPDPAAGPVVAGMGFGIVNRGNEPIAVASSGDGGYEEGLLYPYAQDPQAGERQFGGPGLQWAVDHPEGSNGVVTFSIMDTHGTSVTGTAGWYFTWDATAEVGRCAFTLQLKG